MSEKLNIKCLWSGNLCFLKAFFSISISSIHPSQTFFPTWSAVSNSGPIVRLHYLFMCTPSTPQFFVMLSHAWLSLKEKKLLLLFADLQIVARRNLLNKKSAGRVTPNLVPMRLSLPIEIVPWCCIQCLHRTALPLCAAISLLDI